MRRRHRRQTAAALGRVAHPDEDRAISRVITAHDYAAYRFTNRRMVTRPTETHPDAEGVWGTLLLYPREQRLRVERAFR